MNTLPSLPLTKEEVAKQEKVLCFLTELLKYKIDIPNLPLLLSLSVSLQKKAAKSSEKTQEEDEESLINRVGISAAG